MRPRPEAEEQRDDDAEERVADGTCVVYNPATGQRTTCRLGILSVSNMLTIVAVGPGSG